MKANVDIDGFCQKTKGGFGRVKGGYGRVKGGSGRSGFPAIPPEAGFTSKPTGFRIIMKWLLFQISSGCMPTGLIILKCVE